MKVIAHRGACTEALENSWSAFDLAIDSKADRIELDTHLTLDGELIVIHDEDFQRTSNFSGNLKALTRKEIESKVRLKNGENVPFLDEVLERYSSLIEFNIEIKTPSEQAAKAVAELVQKQKSPNKIIISSFERSVCAALSKNFPDLKTALLWEKKLWLPGSFKLGPERFMTNNNLRIFHPDARLVTKSIVDRIKELGWDIFPYIGLSKEKDPENLWIYLMTLGVDGLCTNYPRQMKLWVKETQDDAKRFERNHSVGHATH